MLLAAVAHLRVAASIVFGLPFAPWSLDCLVDSMVSSAHEFGPPTAQETELLSSPPMADTDRRDLHARRVRQQAQHAARETPYYRAAYASLDVDLRRLHYDDIPRLPITSKQALRDDPDAFVAQTARPVARLTTTGTTGTPTVVCFSARELASYIALGTMAALARRTMTAEDIVVIAASARAYLGNVCFAGSCARVGALVDTVGLDAPEILLRRLTERRHLVGKKDRVSVLHTYPSYLGQVIETGLHLGYRPADFGIERLSVGGEIVSRGVLERSRALFGDVIIEQGYGMTEIWPVGGMVCDHGHLHFEPTQGLVETVDPDTLAPVGPDAVASLVVTPFAPFRETTLVLRYNTVDLVAPLGADPLTCSLRSLPATGHLLGKQRLSVRHADGWTCPRHVLDALEGLPDVPLPARCGFWAQGSGVAVEVVARSTGAAVKARIADALQAQGIPLRALCVREDPRDLCRPFPHRGDLREASFQAPPMVYPTHATRRQHAAFNTLEV